MEDVHWCDESSLESLLYLVRHSTNHLLFFLFTYRSEEISPGLGDWLGQLEREHVARGFTLKGLSCPEVDSMLQATFAAPHPVNPALLHTIYTLTEGNPFFIEEVIKSLIAIGELQCINGVWSCKSEQLDPSAFSSIPRSVQDMVRQRASRLSAGAIQMLTLAAVAGRRFDFTLLQQVLQHDE